MSIFHFAIICNSFFGCSFFFNQTNNYFNSPSYEGCIHKAKELIELRGLSGNMRIECEESKIIITGDK